MEKYSFSPAEFSLMEKSCVPFAVYQFIDKRVVTLVLSQGFCDLLGFDDREEAYYIMDNDMYRDAHPDDVARIADAAFRFATEGGEYNTVYRTKTRGEYRIVHAKGRHVYTDTGVRLAVVWYTDEGPYLPSGGEYESELSQDFNKALHENSLIRRMNYDLLTGLPSMAYFFELADAGEKRLLREGVLPALLFIDLNGMKYFNRKHGFAEGDKLIRAVGRVLVKHFSNENCSRLGHDHFAVFTQADGLEDRLNALFEECKTINDGKTLPLRVGIYLDRKDGADVSTACDRAKVACDADRSSFVSCFRYFDEATLAQVERRRYIIDNLDKAIQEKWIKVYYQPIVRTANGRVCDEEALARWIDPSQGFLSPAEFIPVLEDARLIYKLDLYVAEQALEKMKTQARIGLEVVPVSVNLSRADFTACDIVEEIRRRVDESGFGREMLTIEITESVIGQDFDFMKTQIERFQSLGFSVWMDDFGSGYSSLDVLQRIHFDLIKFDMRFMQQFDQGEKSRIILSELIKMAIGLGIETVSEGVETEAQVDFLREVGCTKLQGFYYCRPIPEEDVIERYRQGVQIGFENPLETEYFASLGRINLYDLGIVASEDEESFRHYFNTLPMALIECSKEGFTISRCNRSYRVFTERQAGSVKAGVVVPYAQVMTGGAAVFARAVKRCAEDGERVFLDNEFPNGTVVHSFIRRIAVNPVTGVAACATVVLAVIDKKDRGAEVTYARIAKALSADYFNLYYVSLDTDEFIEYTSNNQQDNLVVERHGKNFFSTSRKDVLRFVYEEDQKIVLRAFTKENVLRALKRKGYFTLTYRLLISGEPVYVSMKVSRMPDDEEHIIIGMTNVDTQMKRQEAFKRMQEEETTYARITALSGDYLCVYTVDPRTEEYSEYSATRNYEVLGIDKRGKKFFAKARKDIAHTVYPEDQDRLLSELTRENVLQEVQNNGFFSITYRLVIEDEPLFVRLKAVMMEEKDGPQLIVGVINIDAQVKREQEYARRLTEARNSANIDELTGVKNLKAYLGAQARFDHLIDDKMPVKFSIVLFEILGLDHLRETQGDRAVNLKVREACTAICTIFKRSPVFRIGEGTFAAIPQGNDDENVDQLIAELDARNRENSDILIARGMARFSQDHNAAAVADLAAAALEKNRKALSE